MGLPEAMSRASTWRRRDARADFRTCRARMHASSDKGRNLMRTQSSEVVLSTNNAATLGFTIHRYVVLNPI